MSDDRDEPATCGQPDCDDCQRRTLLPQDPSYWLHNMPGCRKSKRAAFEALMHTDKSQPLTICHDEKIERLKAEITRLTDALQGIIDWCDLALKLQDEFDSHGVRNLTGPAFDLAREVLSRSAAARKTAQE